MISGLIKNSFQRLLAPIFFAGIISVIVYLHSDIWINFSDEGFLWYGASHILKGQVPILDFESYDPGRYYWCASFFALFGERLMVLRLAAVMFQFIALCFGLYTLRKVVSSNILLILFGFTASSWMFLYYRYFDAGIPLIALFFAYRLAEKNSLKRHVGAGVFSGLSLFFGLNHGLFVSAGLLTLMLYLNRGAAPRDNFKKLLFYFLGIFIGLIPIIGMSFLIPGFFESYVDRFFSIGFIRLEGKANTSIPVLWPWKADWFKICQTSPVLGYRVSAYLNSFCIGLAFIGVIFYYLVSVPILFFKKMKRDSSRALFVSATIIGFFYLAHIFGRRDAVYLGESIFPVAAGLASLRSFKESKFLRTFFSAATGFYLIISFFAAGLLSPIAFKIMAPKNVFTRYSIGGDLIWISNDEAKYCENFKKTIAQYVKPDEPIFLAPLLTTFYCILQKDSPVYELYFHLPVSRFIDERNTRQLHEKQVKWAIVSDLLVDANPLFKFSRTHPILWSYLTAHFDLVTQDNLMPGYFLIEKRTKS